MYEDYEDYEDYKEDKQDEIYLLKRKMQERRLPEENILDFFPYEKYPIRDAQRTAIQGIEKALAEGKKYIFIQGPTGFGKSALAYTLLRYFGEGYVCTSSIALQEQYLRDFNTLLKV
jgi:Rad3-related DNA helicase